MIIFIKVLPYTGVKMSDDKSDEIPMAECGSCRAVIPLNSKECAECGIQPNDAQFQGKVPFDALLGFLTTVFFNSRCPGVNVLYISRLSDQGE